MIIQGNFLGATIVAIIYTIYIVWNPLPIRLQTALILIILNALTIILMAYVFKK